MRFRSKEPDQERTVLRMLNIILLFYFLLTIFGRIFHGFGSGFSGSGFCPDPDKWTRIRDMLTRPIFLFFLPIL